MRYTIKKVLNSSVVLVHDGNDNEFIMLKKGIGYGKKSGESILEEDDNQIFVPIENSKLKQFQELMKEIPIEILQLTQKIILEAESILHTTLDKNLYFLLVDHLNFAIERMKKGVKISNRVFWEIKNYYPNEFKAGIVALSIVKHTLGIQLPQEEAANIAFHFANAMPTHLDPYDTLRYAKVIGDIIQIVAFSLNCTLDKTSVHYMRFVTHIKFFVERYFADNMLVNSCDALYLQMKASYPKEERIALKIRDYLETKYEKELPKEELAFLIVHIARIAIEKEKKEDRIV